MWPPGTFLGMLSESTRDQILRLGTSKQYLPDNVLMLEGDKTTEVMVLTDGWVKVIGSTEDGGQALLSLRVGGDLLGEQSALDDIPRSATVISASMTTARVINQRDFLDALRKWPDAAVAVGRALSSELRWATRRRVDFSTLPVVARLARVLCELGRRNGHQVPTGIELQFPLTQPDLAGLVGASEPAIHKALRQLRNDGVVLTGYRHVVIADPVALDAIARAPRPALVPV